MATPTKVSTTDDAADDAAVQQLAKELADLHSRVHALSPRHFLLQTVPMLTHDTEWFLGRGQSGTVYISRTRIDLASRFRTGADTFPKLRPFFQSAHGKVSAMKDAMKPGEWRFFAIRAPEGHPSNAPDYHPLNTGFNAAICKQADGSIVEFAMDAEVDLARDVLCSAVELVKGPNT